MQRRKHVLKGYLGIRGTAPVRMEGASPLIRIREEREQHQNLVITIKVGKEQIDFVAGKADALGVEQSFVI